MPGRARLAAASGHARILRSVDASWQRRDVRTGLAAAGRRAA
jgi:hypothetical protein